MKKTAVAGDVLKKDLIGSLTTLFLNIISLKLTELDIWAPLGYNITL